MPELLTRPSIAPVLNWYKSFDGMPYEAAATRLSAESIIECDGDIDAAIGYELGYKLGEFITDPDQGEAVTEWVIRNIPCRLD